jgi:hypothetical protein
MRKSRRCCASPDGAPSTYPCRVHADEICNDVGGLTIRLPIRGRKGYAGVLRGCRGVPAVVGARLANARGQMRARPPTGVGGGVGLRG